MPNNNAIYNAVIAGVTGGAQHRWVNQPAAAYTDFADVVLEIAVEVDSLIPVSPAIGIAQARLMECVCAGVYSDRFPISSGISDIATAIVNLYNAQVSNLLSEGGGGGGGGVPLSTVTFVDGGAAAAGDGSIATPYQTITEAVSFLPLGNVVSIYITPGNYTSEPEILVPGGRTLNFIGMEVTALTQLPAMRAQEAGDFRFQNCFAGVFVDEAGGCQITLRDSCCNGITGLDSYVYGISDGLPNAPFAQLFNLQGIFQLVSLSGYSFVDTSAIVEAANVSLYNNSVFVCQEWRGTHITMEDSNYVGDLTSTGLGIAQALDCQMGNSVVTGFTALGPLSLINCEIGSMDFNCADNAVVMDGKTMARFGRLAGTENCTSTGMIASNDSGEMAFVTAADANVTYTAGNLNAHHAIVPELIITAPRVIKLSAIGGEDKGLFVIDCFPQGFAVAVQQDLDAALLYTFPTSSASWIRATFRIVSAVGNTWELFNLERIY